MFDGLSKTRIQNANPSLFVLLLFLPWSEPIDPGEPSGNCLFFESVPFLLLLADRASRCNIWIRTQKLRRSTRAETDRPSCYLSWLQPSPPFYLPHCLELFSPPQRSSWMNWPGGTATFFPCIMPSKVNTSTVVPGHVPRLAYRKYRLEIKSS